MKIGGDTDLRGAWGNNGLRANPNGEVHGVIIPAPVSLMKREGKHCCIIPEGQRTQ